MLQNQIGFHRIVCKNVNTNPMKKQAEWVVHALSGIDRR